MSNLINRYFQNNQTPVYNQRDVKPVSKPTFSVPSVDSTMDTFDKQTDKLIKPLHGRGYLVSDSPLNAPKEFVRDTVYTTKALADGVRGKANDHQLGKLNDLGLKIGGLAIATYLMTKKSTPKAKLMEFIGFGTFLLSMKLWPKLALELPARLVHGFNYRKKYVDDQGRKKEVGLDPNYMPFDLYRGERKSEDLNVIGDRMGIRKDLVNRQEAVKDQMRKISVQNNTLWMLTAGIATPIMTALACNKAEEYITPLAEKYSNKKVNKEIDEVYEYLTNPSSEKASAFESSKLGGKTAPKTETVVNELQKQRILKGEDVTRLSETLADGFNAEMKAAANEDIRRIIGGEKYITNQRTAKGLANELHTMIAKGDSALAGKITPDKIEQAVAQGTIRGAVRNLLTSVGVDVIDVAESGASRNLLNEVSTNFKCKDVANIDFFAITEETRNMTPRERLAHNIKSIVLKVNNSNPAEDFVSKMSALEQGDRVLKGKIDSHIIAQADDIAREFYEGTLAIGEQRQEYVTDAVSKLFKKEAPKTSSAKTLFHEIKTGIASHFGKNKGYILTDSAATTIKEAGHTIHRFNIIDRILGNGAHFKIEKANETLVANNWTEVTDTLFKELGITEKELSIASKNKALAQEMFNQKLEAACADPKRYEKLITSLAKTMSKLDEKMDASINGGEGMITKIEKGIDKNCRRTGSALEGLNFREMQKALVSSEHAGTGINIGSIMNAKKERLHSRIDGVHGSYMRLIQSCEFMHRSSGYTKAIESLNAEGADFAKIAKEMGLELPANIAEHKTFLNAKIAERYGMDTSQEVSKEIIAKGKKLLLEAHTNQYYNKAGSINNPNFFSKLMKSIFRPGASADINQGWNQATESTIELLNREVKSSTGGEPLRVFEGTKAFGRKLKEHMNHMFNTLGSIERKVYQGHESLKVGLGAAAKDAKASAIFDLVGKTPSEMFFDTAKQKFNTAKWMKTFKPILGITVAGTLLAQFFFGKKDPDIKA